MAKVSKNQLTERLNALDLEKTAKTTGFTKRSDSKISLQSFIESFMHSFMFGDFSLSDWASELSVQSGTNVTKQALHCKASFMTDK